MTDDRPLRSEGTGDIWHRLRRYEDSGPDPDPGKYWSTLEAVLEEIEALRVELAVAQHHRAELTAYSERMETANYTLQNELQACKDKLERLNALTYYQTLDR